MSRDRDVRHVTIADVTRDPAANRKAPQIAVSVEHSAGRGTLRWTPDTGAEANVVGIPEAQDLGVDVTHLRPSSDKLFAAGGKELDSAGTFSCEMTLGSRRITTQVAVLNEFSGALLSWFDCIGLGILPPDFPRQIQSVEHAMNDNVPQGRSENRSKSIFSPNRRNLNEAGQRRSRSTVAMGPVSATKESGATHTLILERSRTEELTDHVTQKSRHSAVPLWDLERAPTEQERASHAQSFKSAFPRVFEETALRKMAGPPMRIQLKEDAKPFALTAARAIPYAWRDDIKEQLDELERQGIVVPVNAPTEWCHPMIPVAKTSSDGKQKVRLCVDMTKLNEHVRRPTYPTRSPHDVISAVKTGSSTLPSWTPKAGFSRSLSMKMTSL